MPWRDLHFRVPFLEMFFDRVAMGLRPTQGDEKRLGPATTLYGTVALPFVIPTEAKRSGGICSSADLSWKCFSTERTRISCRAALDMAACAAFVKESRMKIDNATKLNRKSGVARWRDLRFCTL
jgi:hypothetical protein